MKTKINRLKNLTYWSLFLFIALIALGGVMNKIEAYEQTNYTNSIIRHSDTTVLHSDLAKKDIRSNSTIKPIKLLTNNPDIETKIREIADKENFKWNDYLIKLAWCESRLNPKATNDNGKYGLDRGVFQINNKYHPNVTDEQAFDIEFATRWTINKINGGYQHLWACDNLIKRNLVKL